MHMPPKPTAGRIRLISVVRVLAVHSQVLHVLDIPGGSQRFYSTAHVAARRDFSFSSLVTQPLGLSFDFDPSSTTVWGMLSYLGKWAQQWWPRYMWTWSGMGEGENKEVITELYMLSLLRLLPSTPRSQGLMCGKRGHSGGSAPYVLLNNWTALPRQCVLFSGVFPTVELFTPIPSGCFSVIQSDQQNSLPGSALS